MDARGIAVQSAISFTLMLTATLPAAAQVCSHPSNTGFYQDNGYTIRKIEIRNPFDFIFLVRHRMDKIKQGLSIAEGQPLSSTKYNASAEYLKHSVKSDDAFGNSHAKLVVVTAGLENCQEKDGGPKTVDVIYRIFSTDPLAAGPGLPEKRQSTADEPATTAVEDSTKALYKFRPLLGYEDSRRGYGGIDLLLRIPAHVFEDIHLSASGSPNSRTLEFQLDGSKTTDLGALERVEYHLAYNYSRLPALNLRLATGGFQARFTGLSKPRETYSSSLSVRYGASVALGNQHGNLTTTLPLSDTVTSSAYGTVGAYIGITRTTRYSEATLSYGLQIGGTGLGNLTFTRQVGDVIYSHRFPGGTHSPWDIQIRFSMGNITGSRVLLNERFFGGNSVSNFISGDAWFIPSGPVVRSIPSNRLNGTGLGGTSFYSTNLTIGKVVISSPLIPQEIEQAEGFASGIESAENTAERFFADDYLASSPEFKKLAIEQAGRLKADLDAVQDTFKGIRAYGAVTPTLDSFLKDAEKQARLVQNIIRHATVPDARGRINALDLVALLNPSTSRLLKLLAIFPKLQPLVSYHVNTQLLASQARVKQHLSELRAALDTIQTGPVGQEATAHAHRDMRRPRETIDALRREVNRFSVSAVGILDSGRIWPDPNGTRYAFGAGTRFSLVNVNFTAGYAINPHPRLELGQGRGALFFSLTYTNFFR